MSRMYQIHEDDLDALESNLSLILSEGTNNLWSVRPDLREAWQMTIKTLSDVRFNYGPPLEQQEKEK